MGITLPPVKDCWPCTFYNSEYGLCDLPACEKVNGACKVYKQYKDIFLRQQRRYEKLCSGACYGSSVTK